MSSTLTPPRGALVALLAILFAFALPAVAHATPGPVNCNVDDLAFGSGCAVTFADTAAGTTSTITVQLTGGAMSGMGAVSLSSADPAYAVSNDTCTGATLTMGATCTFDLVFSPWDDGTAATHPRAQASLTISEGMMADGAMTIDAQQHTGGGGGAPSYGGTVTPGSKFFGAVVAGATASQTFTVTGTSTSPLQLTASSISGTGASDYAIISDGCAGQSLNQNATCAIVVRFQAGAGSGARSSSASLAVASNADAPIGAALTGTVVAVDPGLGVAPGTTPSPDGGDPFTFTNTGNVPLHLTGATITGTGAANMSVGIDGCKDVTVAAGATCDVSIKYQQILAGPTRVQITVGGDASASIVASHADPSVVALGVSPAGGASSTMVGWTVRRTYTFTNPGPLSVHLTGASASGDAAFSVQGDGCQDATLAAGASCSVETAFALGTAGAHTATLKVDGEAAAGNVTVTVTATPVFAPAPTTAPTTKETLTPAMASARDTTLDLLEAGRLKAGARSKAFPVETSTTFTLSSGRPTIAVVRGGATVAQDDGDSNWVQAIIDAGPDDTIEVDGAPLSAENVAAFKKAFREQSGQDQASSSLTGTDTTKNSTKLAVRARAAKAPQAKMVGKTCVNGRCTVRIQWSKTPGVYAVSIVVGHTATGKADGYALAGVVLPRLTAPKTAETCVTLGQGASTKSMRFGISSAAKLTWTLAAASKQPKEPRGCEDSKKWPALKASSKAIASGVVAGAGTARTTSMAKILNKVRLAKLQPGFYRVRFDATAAGLQATPLNWWIQVLPQEATVGS